MKTFKFNNLIIKIEPYFFNNDINNDGIKVIVEYKNFFKKIKTLCSFVTLNFKQFDSYDVNDIIYLIELYFKKLNVELSNYILEFPDEQKNIKRSLKEIIKNQKIFLKNKY